MEMRPATPLDQAAIRHLLLDSRLPVDDLETAAIDFIVARDATGLMGVIGLERFGSAGLLRSLAVRDDQRGRGVGGQLVRAIEGRAVSLGVQQLVLLTETAAPFFGKRGYAAIARDQAPTTVQRSSEFHVICPASATCMLKPLLIGMLS